MSLSFVFEGLGQLMETLLITNARFIRAINSNGVKKMFRNILALQQNIKIISEGSQVEFDRAKRYYTLFSKSPTVRRIHPGRCPILILSRRISSIPFELSKNSPLMNTKLS